MAGEIDTDVGGADDRTRLWVLDLEGSTIGPLNTTLRRQNLERFLRAVLRREARGRPFLRRTDAARFFRAYGEALGLSRAATREEWGVAAERATRGPGWRHRIGWVLEERFGDLEARDGRARVGSNG